LIGPNGEQVGIVRIEDALRVAADADLDLVEVAPAAKPPVCKIMDYGKFKYETALKERESRKNQQQTVVKEQKLRPKIVADYGFVETSAKQDGRNMTMVLAPHRGAKTKARAAHDAAAPQAQRAVPAPAEPAATPASEPAADPSQT
jgi:translation initiation factor IF-3